MIRFAIAAVLAGVAAGAAGEDAPPAYTSCFGSDQVRDDPAGRRVAAGAVRAARTALDTLPSYRACVGFISLFQGASWGVVESAGKDRRRWHMRHSGGHPPLESELEVVQVGDEAWFRPGSGAWTRVPAGKALRDALPKEAWLPDPVDMASSFFEKDSKLVGAGAATTRAGACEAWMKTGHPAGSSFQEVLYVGALDRRPCRVFSGGPAIEAYLRIELYDYGAPIEIVAPAAAR